MEPLGLGAMLIGTYCAPEPMGMFQMLSLAKGCARGSRATVCADRGKAAERRSKNAAARIAAAGWIVDCMMAPM
jgi:hypothetical protein